MFYFDKSSADFLRYCSFKLANPTPVDIPRPKFYFLDEFLRDERAELFLLPEP